MLLMLFATPSGKLLVSSRVDLVLDTRGARLASRLRSHKPFTLGPKPANNCRPPTLRALSHVATTLAWKGGRVFRQAGERATTFCWIELECGMFGEHKVFAAGSGSGTKPTKSTSGNQAAVSQTFRTRAQAGVAARSPSRNCSRLQPTLSHVATILPLRGGRVFRQTGERATRVWWVGLECDIFGDSEKDDAVFDWPNFDSLLGDGRSHVASKPSTSRCWWFLLLAGATPLTRGVWGFGIPFEGTTFTQLPPTRYTLVVVVFVACWVWARGDTDGDSDPGDTDSVSVSDSSEDSGAPVEVRPSVVAGGAVLPCAGSSDEDFSEAKL